MTPGLAIWTASGRAHPDNNTKHNAGKLVQTTKSEICDVIEKSLQEMLC